MALGDIYTVHDRIPLGFVDPLKPRDECGWDLDTIGPPTVEQAKCYSRKIAQEARNEVYRLIELNDELNPQNLFGFKEDLDELMDDITAWEARWLAAIDSGDLPLGSK